MLIYKCSVCKTIFRSKARWHEHFPREKHQQLAMKELSSWKPSVRDCVLIFMKIPVDKDVKVIKQLSEDGRDNITDFIVLSWEGRPRIGMIRFETRKSLLRVLKLMPLEVDSPEQKFEIDGSWLEVRDGGAVTDHEWKDLIDPELIITIDDDSENEAYIPPALTPPGPSAKRIKLGTLEQEGEEVTIENGMSTISLEEGLGLRDHLSFLQNLMAIPDEEYNTALEITRTLQRSLNVSQRDGAVGQILLKAALCRHWMLKLKYSPTEDLDNVGCVAHISCDPPSWLRRQRVLEVCVSQSFWLAEEVLHYVVKETEPDNSLGICNSNIIPHSCDKGPRFIKRRHFEPLANSKLPRFTMSFMYKPAFIVEAQTWRLLKYLCSFDSRCSYVLSLAYYWAKINSISIGKSYDEGTHMELADPSGLNWLVMFFFQSEGLIPDTRSVLKQPHKPLGLTVVGTWQTDFGFSDDERYVASWKQRRNLSYELSDAGQEKFAHDVFTLFYKFLLFCGTQLGSSKGDHGWILNTRDSERIPIADALAHEAVNYKLTLSQLRGILNTESQDKIVMLNPFFKYGRISLCNDETAFRAMRETGVKLERYFASGTNSKREKLGLEEFLELFKAFSSL